MTQSPWCARITSGWIASLPCSPLDTVPGRLLRPHRGDVAVEHVHESSSGRAPRTGSAVMSTLIAEMLNVSCGALAQGLAAAVVVPGVDAAGGTAAIAAVAPGLTK